MDKINVDGQVCGRRGVAERFFSSHCTLRFGEKHRNYHVIVKSRWEMPITAIGRPVADAA
jgi:hypothetical protein